MSPGPASQRVVLLRTPNPDTGKHTVETGTLISDRLVLTTAHGVFTDEGTPREKVTVGLVAETGPPDWRGLAATRVVWPGEYLKDSMPGRALDMALVEITGPDWKKPEGLAEHVRLGTLTGRSGGVAVEAIGFPLALMTSDWEFVADHVTATINPSGARAVDRYDLTVTSSHPVDGGWDGLSGAGIFTGELLIGVAAFDIEKYGHSRLSAIPVRRLVKASGANEILRDHGFDCRLQSAELTDLVTMVPPKDPYRSPAALLRPEARIVELFDRVKDIKELREWCDTKPKIDRQETVEKGIEIALIAGQGGIGKTRLAHELVRAYAERGWVAGFLESDIIDGGRATSFWPIADTALDAPGILLAIDNANSRPGQIIKLVGDLQKVNDRPRIRLLLLARSQGDWWTKLEESYCAMVKNACVIRLDGIGGTRRAGTDEFGAADGIRRKAFEVAVLSFARADALPSIFPAHQCDWSEVAHGINPPDDIEGNAYSSPLTLQLTALTALLRHANVTVANQLASPEEELISHERHYWRTSAEMAKPPFGKDYPEESLSTFVAAASLFGARTSDEGKKIIGQLEDMSDCDVKVVKGIARWLHELYPPDDESEYWGVLQPDRLAEHHLRALARKENGLLRALFCNAEPEEAVRARDLLKRAADRHEVLIGQLKTLLMTSNHSSDLPCRDELASVLRELEVPPLRYSANLAADQQFVNSVGAPASARVSHSGASPINWLPDLTTDLPLRRGDEW
jgi:hypothetical protein